MRIALATLIAVCSLFSFAGRADAFCGFYVGGAGAKMFNNATMVVLMRDGTRTVLSMQNNYQGPPEKFALVVPVPVVLQKENVKTLAREVFDRLDELAAPRLVEYWEEDPCAQVGYGFGRGTAKSGARPSPSKQDGMPGKPPEVRVLAQFTVGEYEIVILGADDSIALDGWLKKEGYAIPEGAEPILRPYVKAGMKFFVAKVDPTKVKFEGGQAMLSPLRFHYDTETFALPVRLGLVNSSGTQDLIVHVLARGKRYEVANYDNVAIPTNLDVNPGVKKAFATFYASLFDRTIAKHPGAIVTEYAWDAGWCDPCPAPPLSARDIATLGGDVLPEPSTGPRGFVLTRLHARYGKTAGQDLVFRAVQAIAGGREQYDSDGTKLETGAKPAGTNTFQARYALRHRWAGAIACKDPIRGNWGSPPPGVPEPSPSPATKLAFVPRGADLTNLIAPLSRAEGMAGGARLSSATQMDPLVSMAKAAPTVAASASAAPSGSAPPPATAPVPPPVTPKAPVPPPAGPPPEQPAGCAGCTTARAGSPVAWLGLVVALGLAAARRRRSSPSPRDLNRREPDGALARVARGVAELQSLRGGSAGRR